MYCMPNQLSDTRFDTSAPNCIKDFLDLQDDTGQSGLTLQLFPMVILVNQVWRYNCNVKPDWPEQAYCPMKMLYTIGCWRLSEPSPVQNQTNAGFCQGLKSWENSLISPQK